MAKVVPLNNTNHKDLKVSPNCAIDVVKNQHLVNIRVSEISKASACMPVFLNKYEDSELWAVSAITSLEVKKNLFVIDGNWSVNYIPNILKTYPFFLVGGQKEGEFVVGIDEDDKAFNQKDGLNVFDESGNSTQAMQNVIKLLEADITGQAHTRKFVETLQTFDLILPLTMRVKYEDGQVNSLTGLRSVNEKKLQELSDDEFLKLRQTGFLGPIYSLILSVYQLNELMSRHNKVSGNKKILQVTMQPDDQPEVKSTAQPNKAKTVTKKATVKKKVTKKVTPMSAEEVAKKKALEAAKKKALEAAKAKKIVKAKTTKKVIKKVVKK